MRRARNAAIAAVRPVACVIGGSMDLVRPLGLAGIPSVVVALPGDRMRFSRFTLEAIDADGGDMLERLERFARGQPERPVLYYQSDETLRFVSLHRDRLAPHFRFVIPGESQVETMLDKGRFADRARALMLPVPRSVRLDAAQAQAGDAVDIEFPLVVKAHNRDARWLPLGTSAPGASDPSYSAKVLRVATRVQLAALWPRLVESGLDILLQEEIPGPESSVESYHAYVDENGRVAGEFTGRKIRTLPPLHGFSTALTSTEAPDVVETGRDILERLEFRGVAKLDFKRAPDGRLLLLEINPRFTLWNHLGALAGVNLPALVHADLSGRPRPPAARARGGVCWCRPWKDLAAARACGVPLGKWFPWMIRCEANSAWAWDDPMPFVKGKLGPRITRRVARLRRSDG